MKITSIYIQNFRKLLQCHIEFSDKTTLFVGANNSGKTSAMDALGKFLAGRSFAFNDLTISNRKMINDIGIEWVKENAEMPEDISSWEILVPKMDIWLEVSSQEIHHVASIIPTLKWRGGNLGIRLAFLPKDISKLFNDYREAYLAARKTENSKERGPSTFNLHPKDLCDYLERKLNTYLSIKAFILDPSKMEDVQLQSTSLEMECFTDNPLKGIIKIDMIDAQRGFSDPDSLGSGERVRKQLSSQMRSYYDKHLDPEKAPTPEDIDILEATEKARNVFDENLADKFEPAIRELEGLGYPGISDPKLTITTKITAGESLKHDSAVQYSLSKSDNTLKLPEKYNGLGYQNLISMVFDLMHYRDDWMRVGKAKHMHDDDNLVIEPLHLVLVEEPEAHLHVQVQQVFIRKAYDVLTNHVFLKENANYTTQLIISTHSSHIAREADFKDLRYFKRLHEGAECSIATSKVINLSDVFGKGDNTDKFVTRYLQTTHCDLFFADAAILVEGAAEGMLLPHFIRNKYPELYQRYISLLSINGRHAHRLGPLIRKLCLPTLIISDLDVGEKADHHKAARPQREKDLISTNYTITQWLIKESDLDKLLNLEDNKKEIKGSDFVKLFDESDDKKEVKGSDLDKLLEQSDDKKEINKGILNNYSIRIAYQTPVYIEFKGIEAEAIAGTFEDSLVYSNFNLFKDIEDRHDTGSLVKAVKNAIESESNFDELHNKIYLTLRKGQSNLKAEFALDVIYAIDPYKITVPAYIDTGLDWLQKFLVQED